MSQTRSYCLISPCRDEQEYMIRTLETVTNQSVLPAQWVIVDDGSKDNTPQILQRWAERFSFIKIITRTDRGRRKVGPGVIEAFYAGYNAIEPEDFDYICKLDLDLELPPKYFEVLIGKMEKDTRLGTCSGKPYMMKNEQKISEKCGDENSVGMTKMYRRECFEQIRGFVQEVMWDGIDGHRCRMLGWKAASFDEEAIQFIHLRPMGSSYRGILTGRMRHGFGQYFMGTSLLYMIVSSIYRMFQPPWVFGGAAMLVGYLKSMFLGVARYEDRSFGKFLREYQWQCLLLGKAEATRRLDHVQEKIWKDRNPKGKGYKRR